MFGPAIVENDLPWPWSDPMARRASTRDAPLDQGSMTLPEPSSKTHICNRYLLIETGRPAYTKA